MSIGKNRFVWLTVALSLALAAGASAQVSTYTAYLTGAGELPAAGDPDAVGFAVINIDQGASAITFTAYVQNVATITASHIHRGGAGVGGPVIIPFGLPFTNGVSTGTLPGIAPSLLAEIVANPPGYYFNVHNADFPGGAARGQLRAAPATAAPTVITIPVAVKLVGAKGENFVEDVRIINKSSSAATVVIDFFASNSAGLSGPTSTKSVTVAPAQQLVLNDILGGTFGMTAPAIGSLRLTTDKDIVADGRILDDKRPNGGQLGFFIHGLGIETTCRFGTLPALSQASAAEVSAGIGLRTNIGYFNPNPLPTASVVVTFTARKTSDGSSLGAKTLTIPPLAHAQLPVFSLIDTVAAADQKQDDFYVTYSTAGISGNNTSGGPVFVYFAVGDNFSGDSYYSAGLCGQL